MSADVTDRMLRNVCGVSAALVPAVVALPLLLAPLHWPVFRFVHWSVPPSFELLGLTATAGLLCALAISVRRFRPQGDQWIPTAFFVAAVLWSANLIVEFSARSYDYECYAAAADAIRHGVSPYSNPTFDYIYPPLLAQLLAWASYALERIAPALSPSATVFYLYQVGQLLSLAALFPLLYTLLRRHRVDPIVAASLSLAAILINVPLIRSVENNQIVLIVLVLSLTAALNADRPVVAGIALAIGTHLKIYPVLLLPVFLVFGYRRVALAWAAAMLPFLLIPGTVEAWRELISRMSELGQGAFVNNSVWSVAYNVTAWSGASPAAAQNVARVLQTAAAVAAIVWMAWRLRAHASDPSRFLLAAAEWMALMILVSPLAWEHTFILAIPFALAAGAQLPAARRVKFIAAAGATFLVPTFGVFLISDHRLAGVLVMLALAPPLGGGLPKNIDPAL